MQVYNVLTMMYYLLSIDMYFHPQCGLLSLDEVNWYDHQKKIWDSLQNDFNPIEMFPKAKSIYKKQLQKEIKQAREDLAEARQIKKDCEFVLETRCHSKNREFWEMMIDGLLIQPLTAGREQTIKRNTFRLSDNKKETTGVTEEQIAQAKSVPISTFIKANNSGFAKCPFHAEKIPSLKVYTTQNTWWCFSCGSGGDVIELIMKMHDIDFINAVKMLTR